MERCPLSSDGGQNEIRILITEQVGVDVHLRINAIIAKDGIDIQLRIRFRIVARVIHTLDVVAVSVRAEVLFDHALSIPRFEGERKGLCATNQCVTSTHAPACLRRVRQGLSPRHQVTGFSRVRSHEVSRCLRCCCAVASNSG